MNTKIIKLEETDSTNTYLKNYSPSDDEEMVVAVADYQTAGRGQGTHAWESEHGKEPPLQYLGASGVGAGNPSVSFVYGRSHSLERCS